MANKRRRRKKSSIWKWFKKLSTGKKIALIACIVILVLLFVVVLFVASKFSKLNTEKIEESEIYIPEFEEEEEVGVGYTNFVLFGGDSRFGDVDKDLNTDAIIIVSLNNETKEIKMVSVYRDTLLDLTNGSIQKCNSAYSRGGAKQAINMLNMNLDLNIQKYVTVSFEAVINVIDMLGGIEVNVSEAEMAETNRHMVDTAKATGRSVHYLTHAGLQTLDGIQATTYARIRKGVGDDYARTERQRLVIQLTAEKAMKAGIGTLNEIIDEVFPQVSTNLTMTEILKYASSLTKYQIGETSGFPFEKNAGVLSGKGDCVYPINLAANVQQLHEFLYGTVDYQPSKKVQSISNEIAYIVSTRLVDDEYESTTDDPDTSTDSETGDESGSTGTGDEGGNTGTGDEGGSTGSGDESGSTGSGDEGGSTGSGDAGGSTGSGDEGGSTGTGDEGGSTGSGDEGGSTGSGDEGGSTGSGDAGGSTGTGSEGSTITDENTESGSTE